MKFANGNWLVPDHLEVMHPVDAYRARRDGNTLVVTVSAWRLQDRADQINGRLFTLRFSSPMEGVIGVHMDHFRGGLDKGPTFELSRDKSFAPEIEIGAETARLTSGALTVEVALKGPWKVRFLRQGTEITASSPKASGHARDLSDNGKPHMFERLDLGIGGLVYGLGERFTSLVKNGQSVTIWNEDGGANTEQAYKNIPFFLTNKGWGVFVNNPGKVEFEIGSEKASKAQFSVPGEALDYYLIDGQEPKKVIERYTQMTGRPSLPAPWSFGL